MRGKSLHRYFCVIKTLSRTPKDVKKGASIYLRLFSLMVTPRRVFFVLILFDGFERFRHIDFFYLMLHKAIYDERKQNCANKRHKIAEWMYHVIEIYHIDFNHTHNCQMEQLSEWQADDTCYNGEDKVFL